MEGLTARIEHARLHAQPELLANEAPVVWGDEAEEWVLSIYGMISRIKPRSARGLVTRARELIRAAGVNPNPVGSDNAKVGGPGTYRPTDGSCPKSCPFYDGCYVQAGHMSSANNRASAALAPSLSATLIAVLLSSRYKQLVRLHTGGDFYRTDEERVDLDYVQGLVFIGAILKAERGPHRVARHKGIWAWTYTHIPPAQFGWAYAALYGAGINVMWSDALHAGGAVVWDHDDLDSLAELVGDGAEVVPCPAQTLGVNCQTCRMCMAQDAGNRVVVFHPHGSYANHVREKSREVLL